MCTTVVFPCLISVHILVTDLSKWILLAAVFQNHSPTLFLDITLKQMGHIFFHQVTLVLFFDSYDPRLCCFDRDAVWMTIGGWGISDLRDEHFWFWTRIGKVFRCVPFPQRCVRIWFIHIIILLDKFMWHRVLSPPGFPRGHVSHLLFNTSYGRYFLTLANTSTSIQHVFSYLIKICTTVLNTCSFMPL